MDNQYCNEDYEAKEFVNTWLQPQASSFHERGIQKL